MNTEPTPAPQEAGATSSQPDTLYAKQEKVYPRNVKGPFRTFKTVSLWILLGIFYITPWLRWDRGGDAPDQAILMDIAGRRGYFFGLEIWPQEVYYLTGLLVLAALLLFFFTALLGRVWCGFACFQTVFTDLFVMVERWVEGDRNKRIKLDRGPLTLGKVGKKAFKNLIWLAIAFLTAYTFVLYFDDAPTATVELFKLTAGPWTLATVGILTFTTFLFAGYAREQVCIYMCPYARFQGAMMDEHSMIVTYEAWRGEPRGKAKPGQSFEGRGDCVDCRMCVHACPTGIDIRDGTQMACIGCALCVDACNGVMKRFGLPPGLITYDSESNQIARSRGEPTKLRMLRPRTFVYIGVILAVCAVMAVSLLNRSRLEINILRDRAPLFVRLSDGGIRNGYTYKVLNMEREPKTYTLSVDGLPGATLGVVGYTEQGAEQATIPVDPDTVGSFRVFVTTEPGVLEERSTDIEFVLENQDTGEMVRSETVFIGPRK